MVWERADTVCFTGHRFLSEEERAHLRRRTEETVRTLMMRGYSTYVFGGALGFDTLAQQTVTALRGEFPFLRVVMAIPCRDQDARWHKSDRAVYRQLLAQADERIVLTGDYVPGCMQARDRFMVDHSALCVAYFTGRPGGTMYTVRYARERSVPVCFLT